MSRAHIPTRFSHTVVSEITSFLSQILTERNPNISKQFLLHLIVEYLLDADLYLDLSVSTMK